MTPAGDPPHNPTLADHLAQLKELCRKSGAIEMRLLRDADMAWLYYEADGRVGELRMPKSGVIFIARFPATDGEAPGLS